ncbi:MAG: hypothetical protein JNM86_10665 [Phycisphaerae bacterium]|nr:hypothetical protein [Phycisphaerae bacterium]
MVAPAATPLAPPTFLPAFHPGDSLAAAVLTDLADPARSFLSVARAHNTSPEALSLWLTSPEISERIASMRSAAAIRTRWLAGDHLPSCAELALRIVRTALASPNLPMPDSALRAVNVLLRLASFDPNARPRSTPTRSRESNISAGTATSLQNQFAALLRAHRQPTQSPDSTSPEQDLASFLNDCEGLGPIAPGADDLHALRDQSKHHSVESSAHGRVESVPQSDAETDPEADPNLPILQLPAALLSSILPSFSSAEHNPFDPQSCLRSTSPKQRTIVKLRLKQQRKQIVQDAVAFLIQHNHCTEADIPAVRREIECFYRISQPACIQAARHPP